MKYLKQFKKKSEIVIFCPSIEEGGVEKNLYIISNYLSKKINISLVTANKNKSKMFDKNIKFLSPKNNFWNNKPRLLKTCICLYIILTNFYKKDLKILSFQSNIFAIIISKIFGFKVFIRSNTSPISFANSIIKKIIFKFFFNLSDKIIVNSKIFKNQFYKFFNKKPVLIYNPVFDLLKLNYSAKKKIKNIFFDKKKKYLKIINVARLTDQKDHLTLLKGIMLASKKIKLKLIIIGKGREKNKIINFINENKLNDKVKLLGYIKNPMPYIRHSDIFILSSKFEGLPNVLIEAQSQKKIIISSNCPTGPSEILLNGKLGFLYKTGDYNDLYKTIEYVSSNLKIAKQKANLGFKNLKRFDYKTNCEKYYNLIN
ncbi:RfaG Glycosyltransferase [Candidatus Pelagibacterales bacterium]|jgi:glycosyltransferase involved in cell wall biosynthesis